MKNHGWGNCQELKEQSKVRYKHLNMYKKCNKIFQDKDKANLHHFCAKATIMKAQWESFLTIYQEPPLHKDNKKLPHN